jgi:outer membrane receptor protein involved in Fe transport
MINRDRLEIDGIELQFDYGVRENLGIHLQATYLDLNLVNSDVQLRQRPDWRAGVNVHWSPSDRWLLDATWLYTGETFDSSIPTGDEYLVLDSYSRVDTTVTYRYSDRLHAVFSVTNLLDEGYYQAIGFPAAGTRARLGVRLQF